jgi:hypothetical protein
MAGKADAYLHCKAEPDGHNGWAERHYHALKEAVDCLPSGSGIDSAVLLDWERCDGERITVDISYHHMNENGFYDGWTDHSITVRASLIHGLNIKISGRDRNDIKDYLADLFSEAFRQEWTEVWDVEQEQTRYVLPEHVAGLERAS